MSNDEGFLARWSRRKRQGKAAAVETKTREDASENEAPDTSPSVSPSSDQHEDQSPFDAASLPPVESIGAGSDIRPFLAAGVPAELTRAALRRAWATDPAIRDFIGLSENSWDFNAAGGVPGFGSMTAEEARRLLTQALGEPESTQPTAQVTESPSGEESPPAVGEPKLAARDAGRKTP